MEIKTTVNSNENKIQLKSIAKGNKKFTFEAKQGNETIRYIYQTELDQNDSYYKCLNLITLETNELHENTEISLITIHTIEINIIT